MTATMTAPPSAPTLTRPAADGRPPPVVLSPETDAILLRVARSVVAATSSGRLRRADLSSLLPRDPPAQVLAPAAAFVTLTRGDELRGCVGRLAPDLPLWEAVMSAAVGAASRDSRFLPIFEREIPSLSIDVSVLGPTVPLGDPSAFRPGVDGVIVERGARRGLLLPEVASDQGWGVGEMLAVSCLKAGLPRDAWRDERTQVLVFRTARVSDAAAHA